MLPGMRARMSRMWTRRMKHHKPTLNQRRMWMTEGIALDGVNIGKYISDL